MMPLCDSKFYGDMIFNSLIYLLYPIIVAIKSLDIDPNPKDVPYCYGRICKI